MARTIKSGMLVREANFKSDTINAEKRTVDVVFSSESPVDRSFGPEILDHRSGAVRLDRINQTGAVLFNHDPDKHIGRVHAARLEGGEGIATVQFSNSPLGSEKFRDVQDGILTSLSVGYRVWKMEEQKDAQGKRSYRCTDWEPMEISFVTIPADVAASVRKDNTENEIQILTKSMSENIAPAPAPAAAPVNIEVLRNEAVNIERNRIAEINAFAKLAADKVTNVRDLADKAIADGQSLNDLRKVAFENLKGVEKITSPNPHLGMSERDMSKYSIVRAVHCSVTGKFDGLEGEMHQEAMKQRGVSQRAANSIIIPYDVMAYSKRDQLATTGTLGGNLVATNLLAGSFIDQLINRMKVAQMGATYLPGLTGNVAIPRQTAGAAVYWAASEAAATTEGSILFDQVTMTPKQITARVDYSWQSLLQTTPGIEMLVRNDLNTRLALGIDLACLHGTGSNGQPTGIAATSGIGSVTIGANGGAPTWAAVVALETALANSNADEGTLGYLTNSKVRGKLKNVLKNASGTDASFIWGEGPIQNGFGSVNGYRAGVSNQVASNLTKGTSTTVCSAIFFADWSQLLVGSWGGLEILTNPYTQAGSRVIEVYAYQAVDVAVRHAESFAACLDATTT